MAQDDRFWSVSFLKLMDTSVKLHVNYDHLSSMTATTPNLDLNGPICSQKWQCHFCKSLFCHVGKQCFWPRQKISLQELSSTKNILKETTCLRWPLYIIPQGGHIRRVWLYMMRSKRSISKCVSNVTAQTNLASDKNILMVRSFLFPC